LADFKVSRLEVGKDLEFVVNPFAKGKQNRASARDDGTILEGGLVYLHGKVERCKWVLVSVDAVRNEFSFVLGQHVLVPDDPFFDSEAGLSCCKGGFKSG
jgi:hypothetical protein